MSARNPHSPADRLTRTIIASGIVISLVISVVYLFPPPLVLSINNRTMDVVMSFSEKGAGSGSVVIVDIDEESLARYGQWPWPRYRLSQLLGKIADSGASSIALDMILAEPDRTSPKNWKSSVDGDLGYKVDTSGIPAEKMDHDRHLAEALAKGPYVLGYEFLFRDSAKTNGDCGLHPLRIGEAGGRLANDMHGGFFSATGVVCNRKLFSDAVTGSGFLNATPDSDGILRRAPLVIRFGDRIFPSFSMAALMKWRDIGRIYIGRTAGGSMNLVAGGATIPIDRQGNMIVNFSRTVPVPRVSARAILDGTATRKSLAGRIALVGPSAAGLDQFLQTAASPVYSHLDLHAQVLENLITARTVDRPGIFPAWEAAIAIFLAVATCMAIARLGISGSVAVAAAGLAVAWGGSALALRANGSLFSPLLPTVLVTLNYAVLTIFKEWKNHLAARDVADSTLLLLRSSEKKLNSIIKAVPDIIFRLDPSGRITFISPAISKYTDSPERLIGQPIFDLVAPEDLAKAQHRLNEKRTGERATHDLEVRLLLPHKQDSTVEDVGYFSVSAEGIYRNDTPCTAEFIGTQGIIRDITEQKRLEERLLHAKKMEAIGNLAAGVAHDLNNILAGLVTYPDLLVLDLPESSPMRDKIAVIQRSGQKAAAIVQDLLTLARRGVKVGEPVNMNSIISDYIGSPEYAASIRYHPNVTLSTDLAPDLMNVKGSRVHLSKAIMNVLNNAAESMPAGGRIRVSSCNRYLDTSLRLYEEIPAGEYVCVSVSDEGVGIAAEDREKIFEPFYSKKSMQRSGSGLGMTVIWATVKDHEGYIDLQSREGEGTRIDFYLPATREQSDAVVRRIGLEEYVGTEHVLLVDDMREQLEIASNMLSKLGYAVDTAGSGEDAVEYLKQNSVDLVVLDMIMPGGMDGLETYRRIREIHPGQRAIITSGYSESERVKMLQEIGAGAYVQKPYTLEKFGIAVRRELDRKI